MDDGFNTQKMIQRRVVRVYFCVFEERSCKYLSSIRGSLLFSQKVYQKDIKFIRHYLLSSLLEDPSFTSTCWCHLLDAAALSPPPRAAAQNPPGPRGLERLRRRNLCRVHQSLSFLSCETSSLETPVTSSSRDNHHHHRFHRFHRPNRKQQRLPNARACRFRGRCLGNR